MHSDKHRSDLQTGELRRGGFFQLQMRGRVQAKKQMHISPLSCRMEKKIGG